MVKIEKSLIIKSPKNTPLKSESRTFFEYIAKMMARRDGRRESAESSIKST